MFPVREIQVGKTSNIIEIFIRDSSVSYPKGLTGLAFNTSGLKCRYRRNKSGTTSVNVTLVDIPTLGTYVSGGFKEIDPTNMRGWYEFHPPDAAVSSTGNMQHIAFLLWGATGMADCAFSIQQTGWDNTDGTRGGMTALPNAAAGMTGGLATRGGAIPDATAGSPGGLVVLDSFGNPVGVPNVNVVDVLGTAATLQTYPTNFDALAIGADGTVSLDGSTVLGTPRVLDGIADNAITLNDAWWCAVAAAAGRESVVGTAYTIKTPTGTVIRNFVLDSASSPSSRT